MGSRGERTKAECEDDASPGSAAQGHTNGADHGPTSFPQLDQMRRRQRPFRTLSAEKESVRDVTGRVKPYYKGCTGCQTRQSGAGFGTLREAALESTNAEPDRP